MDDRIPSVEPLRQFEFVVVRVPLWAYICPVLGSLISTSALSTSTSPRTAATATALLERKRKSNDRPLTERMKT